MQDAELDAVMAKYPKLKFNRNQYEYRIFKTDEENKGSRWIAHPRKGYRIVTTGTAHCVDRELERLTGRKGIEYSDRNHKTWKSIALTTLNQIIGIFDGF